MALDSTTMLEAENPGEHRFLLINYGNGERPTAKAWAPSVTVAQGW
jgi:hypothetical protein